jgi:hypothetical protein
MLGNIKFSGASGSEKAVTDQELHKCVQKVALLEASLNTLAQVVQEVTMMEVQLEKELANLKSVLEGAAQDGSQIPSHPPQGDGQANFRQHGDGVGWTKAR